MLFSNGEAIYQAFLEGIKKPSTDTIPRDVFTRIWNIWALTDWVADNVSMREGVELTEKQIEDLRMLREQFDFGPSAVNQFSIPNGTVIYPTVPVSTIPQPLYKRSISKMIKLNYDSSSAQECGLGGISEWMDLHILRSMKKSSTYKSKLKSPSDHMVYYEVIKNNIIIINNETIGSIAYLMRLDYIRYPNEMSVENNLIVYTFDLPQEQLKEILDYAIRLYLERSNDPRYQKWLQIDNQKNISKF